MERLKVSRRDLLIRGGVFAGLSFLNPMLVARLLPAQEGEEVIPFLDQPPEPPSGGRNLLNWEELDSWITPNSKFFRVGHYDKPVIKEKDWKLEIAGLVDRPLSLTLGDLKKRERRELAYTLECSGNHGFPWFVGAVGNARWAGTSLAPLLKEAGIRKGGIEVVFFGADAGEEEVRGIKMKQNFARSMSVNDAMNPNNILCYEMNGEVLPHLHGFPVRLIAPHWYGIANVKWLKRIEVRDKRYMGRFMARDYVTLREEQREGKAVWMETSVGRVLLKSVTAKVTRKDGNYRIHGAAWGAPIRRIDVRIDSGPWVPAEIDRSHKAEFAWKFWHLDWGNPFAGEHTLISRAIDTDGNVQPAMDDPRITKKHTYWESNGQVTRKIRIS